MKIHEEMGKTSITSGRVKSIREYSTEELRAEIEKRNHEELADYVVGHGVLTQDLYLFSYESDLTNGVFLTKAKWDKAVTKLVKQKPNYKKGDTVTFTTNKRMQEREPGHVEGILDFGGPNQHYISTHLLKKFTKKI